MLLDIVKLNELNAALDDARRKSTGPGAGAYCGAPNIDPGTGENYRLETKPKGNRQRLERDGHDVVEAGGRLHVKIPLGVHGRAFLGINPQTGEVRCTECEGGS